MLRGGGKPGERDGGKKCLIVKRFEVSNEVGITEKVTFLIYFFY